MMNTPTRYELISFTLAVLVVVLIVLLIRYL